MLTIRLGTPLDAVLGAHAAQVFRERTVVGLVPSRNSSTAGW